MYTCTVSCSQRRTIDICIAMVRNNSLFALVRWVEPSRLLVPCTSAQPVHATLENERFVYKRRRPAEEKNNKLMHFRTVMHWSYHLCHCVAAPEDGVNVAWKDKVSQM